MARDEFNVLALIGVIAITDWLDFLVPRPTPWFLVAFSSAWFVVVALLYLGRWLTSQKRAS